MYEGYSNAVYETLPSGAVIVDRIHVAKNYRGCTDKARIQKMQALKKTLSDNAYAELKGVMCLFRKSWTTLIEGQQVTLLSLFSYSPVLEQVYILREVLTPRNQEAFYTDHSSSKSRISACRQSVASI